VKIDGYHLQVMINLGAKGNFMSDKAAKLLGVATLIKELPYRVVTANGSDINNNKGIVEVETKPLIMTTASRHQEYIQFNVIPITHLIILGQPWLAVHNPEID